MSLFQNPPIFSPGQLKQMVQDLYDIDGQISPLPSERDQNALVSQDGKALYILKIANVSEDKSVLAIQNRILHHLEAHVDITPRVIPTRDGQLMCEVAAAGGQGSHGVRLLRYISGKPLAQVLSHTPALLYDLGQILARMDLALAQFEPCQVNPDYPWDLDNGLKVIQSHVSLIGDRRLKRMVEDCRQHFLERVLPVLPKLPRSLIHNDANDYNVIVKEQRVVGLIDFGDILNSYTIADLAVAMAYVMLGKEDPLVVAVHLVKGYHEIRPLQEMEIACLFGLVRLRLCVSICMAAWQKQQRPNDDYLFISQQPIIDAFPQLMSINPRLVEVRFRQICGYEPCKEGERVESWLKSACGSFTQVMPIDLPHDPLLVLDLGIASTLYSGDPQHILEADLTRRIAAQMEAASVRVGIGRYNEPRLLYTSDLFHKGRPTDESRTVHLGMDIFMPAGTEVSAPLDGVVHAFARNRAPLDYGPVIILEHQTSAGDPFYTLYGHLSLDSISALKLGQTIAKGQVFARLGTAKVNGGWTPHLHFQLMLDLLGQGTDFPGVVKASEREFWCAVSPDPNLILGIPSEKFPQAQPSKAQSLATRKKRIGPSLSIGYNDPVKVVRGWMQYLYDDGGRRYLDCYNNVPHVGHCHPKVVEAAIKQMGLLSTNTRYLNDNITTYAEQLTATLPEKLEVCYFLNSASEANELALRMARTFTGQRDIIVLEAAYHGHTSALIDISPYKHDGPGGSGAPDWVHKAPLADVYRGDYKADEAKAGEKYAVAVGEIIETLRDRGRKPAGFIAETCPSVGGQIFFPDGYLCEVYRLVRAAGGICIADEVQTGYGRIGTGFYAFESQGVVPDMVILGKPIGNGHPLGALITTRAIADLFNNGMEFFSTFGGNTVSSLIGLTVLQVVQEEQLMTHALKVGERILQGLRPFVDKYPLVGDVRGSGLFLGMELVRDSLTLEPADREASYVVNRLREQGILLGTDGPHHNVIKIRPPMPFNEDNADELVDLLDHTLAELQ